jgi:tetratricopeptide (TPR) repeat protein
VLSRFLSGEASPEEARSVVKHLMKGCRRCMAGIVPLSSSLPLWAMEVEPSDDQTVGDEYDGAIQRAIDAVLRHGTQAPKIKAATRRVHQRLVEKGLKGVSLKRYPDYAVFEALLQRVFELRHEDPQEMVQLAFVAVWTARQMTDYPDAEQADLKTRSLAEFSNALRVADRLHEAGEQLNSAERWYAYGNQDAALGLRLKDIRASLYGAQQHYEAAIELLEEVQRGRLVLGDRRGATRALMAKGIFTAYTGRLEKAFEIFDEALEKIGAAEPELRASALHNKTLFLVEGGRFNEALNLLTEHREDLELASGRLNRIKLLGIEGRIHGALGHLDLAEHAFRSTKQGFAEAGVRGHEAVITLDLATVVLRQDRSRYTEAVTLAVEALKAFSELRIKPQVEEALNVLLDAIQQGLVTAPLLQSVADFVRQAEHDRRAKYQPRFE